MEISNIMVEHLAQLKRAKKKTGSLEFELKKARLALVDLVQLKSDLGLVEQA